MKQFTGTLTDDERRSLRDLLAAGKWAARKLTHARILLKTDASDDRFHWPDQRIADALGVHVSMVERVRPRFVELGFEAALERKQRQTLARPLKLDGRAEARLLALACSLPPEHRATWTMQLLADKFVELKVVASISDETVRTVLKQTCLSPG